MLYVFNVVCTSRLAKCKIPLVSYGAGMCSVLVRKMWDIFKQIERKKIIFNLSLPASSSNNGNKCLKIAIGYSRANETDDEDNNMECWVPSVEEDRGAFNIFDEFDYEE